MLAGAAPRAAAAAAPAAPLLLLRAERRTAEPHRRVRAVARQQRACYDHAAPRPSRYTMESRDNPYAKKKGRYRPETPLSVVIKREGKLLNWPPQHVEQALQTLEHLGNTKHDLGSTYDPARRAMPGGSKLTGMYGKSGILTVEGFRDIMSPTNRLDMDLPMLVLARLLQLFVPQKFWKLSRTLEEENMQRCAEWSEFKPMATTCKYSMNDFKTFLPETEYLRQNDLTVEPPNFQYNEDKVGLDAAMRNKGWTDARERMASDGETPKLRIPEDKNVLGLLGKGLAKTGRFALRHGDGGWEKPSEGTAQN